jgi:hypothetical protein
MPSELARRAARRIHARQRAALATWNESAYRTSLLRSRAAHATSFVLGRRILHCFGDSHATVFRHVAQLGLLPRTSLDLVIISGATALGLANPNSKTRALPQFARVAATIPVQRPLLFMLGEVDCGFVIWHRSQVKGAAPEAELERSIGNYIAFLKGLAAAGHTRLVVAAAPPPTILDHQDWGEIANLRREVTASLSERTALTLQYNARLREWTRRHGYAFLDYEQDVLDARSGVVAEAFRNPDPCDHHLAPAPFAAVMERHLRAAGFD